MCSIPQILIAAPTSGSGKTTVSRGLMALLTQKGLAVQPFKCGPDYIDTKYHAAVCGRASINLDTFMASAEHIRGLYARHAAPADACIVEGMMGMFDGYDRDRGSSAEIAQLLQLPVVLVVDAKSAAYSMAPLLEGFIHFRPEIRIAGVIFNRVGSPRHYEMLREVCTEVGVTCLGYLPKTKALEQESRYLGLDFSQSKGTDTIGTLTELLEQYVDWKLLLEKRLFRYRKCRRKRTRQLSALGNRVACVYWWPVMKNLSLSFMRSTWRYCVGWGVFLSSIRKRISPYRRILICCICRADIRKSIPGSLPELIR